MFKFFENCIIIWESDIGAGDCSFIAHKLGDFLSCFSELKYNQILTYIADPEK